MMQGTLSGTAGDGKLQVTQGELFPSLVRLLIPSVCFSEWVVKKQRRDFVSTKDSAWPLLE